MEYMTWKTNRRKIKRWKMKILFIGCVESSAILLNQLIQMKENIVGVITKKSSKYNSDFVQLGGICERHNIKYLYTNDANSEENEAFIKECGPHVIYCFGWSQLIRPNILNIPPKGCIGLILLI